MGWIIEKISSICPDRAQRRTAPLNAAAEKGCGAAAAGVGRQMQKEHPLGKLEDPKGCSLSALLRLPAFAASVP